MSTVLIRLEGPMQSWGLTVRGPSKAHRKTELRPTKSGVIGLVANALGRDYHDQIDDLAALRFAVRSDRPGNLEVDYHTTGSGEFHLLPGDIYNNPGWSRKANKYQPGRPFDAPYVAPADITCDPAGGVSAKPGLTVITQDWYLADASFLAALSGDQDLTAAIADALAAPARPLYLGRRAYPPAAPLLAGHTDSDDLAAVLAAAARPDRCLPDPLDTWTEPDPSQAASATVVHDQPISYAGPGLRGARLQTVATTAPTDPDLGFFTPDPLLNQNQDTAT